MKRLKCDHIKWLITFSSDYIKRLSLYYKLRKSNACSTREWGRVSPNDLQMLHGRRCQSKLIHGITLLGEGLFILQKWGFCSNLRCQSNINLSKSTNYSVFLEWSLTTKKYAVDCKEIWSGFAKAHSYLSSFFNFLSTLHKPISRDFFVYVQKQVAFVVRIFFNLRIYLPICHHWKCTKIPHRQVLFCEGRLYWILVEWL